uniref:NADH-ubiquinone oxidoreductase chain 6 n=1 Tax=Tetratoma fungorum TaxID=296006 RepID=A0A343C3V6_9CUCU|nr:NADH dehydrogenase subunit 6 [Tetratoma fungorum]AOY39328.1 NADH dehydrogenase subunit 6 [Tetratoma fungorum]ARH54699.1 NADH dehydrogenase subunit 6 [Tetratoma fungorum]
MFLLFSINIMMSLIFIFLSHPLSLGVILLIQTLLISLMTGNFCWNFWFSYIIFLILIGGMLILFIYMTSIASNEKFSLNFKILIIPMISIILMLILNFNFKMNIDSLNNLSLSFNLNFNIIQSMIKYINFPMNMIMMFMIMYLFITLIATVKITNLNNGPLRQLN